MIADVLCLRIDCEYVASSVVETEALFSFSVAIRSNPNVALNPAHAGYPETTASDNTLRDR